MDGAREDTAAGRPLPPNPLGSVLPVPPPSAAARATGGALPPERDETLHVADEPVNVRLNTLNGTLQSISLNLYNPFLGIDLIRLGGSGWEVGLLSALPPLGQTLSTIAGARWLGERRNPKQAGAALFAIARLLLLGLALIHLGAGHAGARSAQWRPLALVALIALSSLPAAVGNLSWQAVLTGLLRPSSRASALAARGVLASLAGVAVPLAAGWWARSSTGTGAYTWLYVLAAVVGVAEAAAFWAMRGNPPVATRRQPILPAARRLWTDPPYRAYTLCCLPFYLGWLMAWPLFTTYQVRVAGATNLWMAVFAAVNSLAAAAGSALWRRVGDRMGARLALPAACMLLAVIPLQYVGSPGLWGIIVNNVLGGFLGAGVNLYLLVRLMEVAPPEDRVVAMGVANTIIGAVGVAGPMLGMALVRVLPMPDIFWVPTALRLGGGLALLAAGIAGGRAAAQGAVA